MLTKSKRKRKDVERETGFEPATNSLEGCDSTPELLPLGVTADLVSLAASRNGGNRRVRPSIGWLRGDQLASMG